MVYWTALENKGKSQDTSMHNDTFRSRYGYKEMHVHNAPKRKNKDFKPVLYGDFRGMLNFKLSEPWALFRHGKDLWSEEHQLPIQWFKSFIKGAVVGAYYGVIYNMVKPQNDYLNKKALISSSKNPFNFGGLKYVYGALRAPAFAGGSIYLSYRLLWDFFMHHGEALEVPEYITHLKIWSVMVPIGTAYFFGPAKIPVAVLASITMFFPFFYTMKEASQKMQSPKHLNPHVYYQDKVSQAEKDYFEYQDHIEDTSVHMSGAPCYGYAGYRADQVGL
jgi:hypothetical protein